MEGVFRLQLNPAGIGSDFAFVFNHLPTFTIKYKSFTTILARQCLFHEVSTELRVFRCNLSPFATQNNGKRCGAISNEDKGRTSQ